MRTLAGTEPRNGHDGATKSDSIRVMLVDDSLTVRTAFARIIDREPDMASVATAASAEIAISQLRQTVVDVILLDLEMPGMGGLEALPQLIATARGAQILVVSSLTEEGAEHTLTALSMGAADTMAKPQSGQFDDSYRAELVARIRALAGRDATASPPTRVSAPPTRSFGEQPRVVAIGASTGGIHALNQFMRALPRSFDLPILVTQHLPASFMPVFARQLEVSSARRTVVASEDLPVEAGTIIVAPGHAHLVTRNLAGQIRCAFSSRPAASGCLPSVDPMLESIGQTYNGAALAVILSGMGRDGTQGARSLVEQGGTVFAQDSHSCAVWGMPRGVIETGQAAAIGSPEHLAGKTVELAGATSWI